MGAPDECDDPALAPPPGRASRRRLADAVIVGAWAVGMGVLVVRLLLHAALGRF